MFLEKWVNNKENLNLNFLLSMHLIMQFVFQDQVKEIYLHGKEDQLTRQ